MSLADRIKAATGNENIGAPLDVVLPPEDVIIVQQDQAISQASTVVAEVQTDIVQVENDIDNIEDRLEDVEQAIDGLEAMINGGKAWNPELAMDLFRQGRTAQIRLFGEETAVSVKGAECFTDLDTAKVEIYNGFESFKETAGEAWKTIKTFFTNLYNHIIAFFKGLFDKFKGLEAKAAAVVTKLNGLADDKIKKEISLGAWNAYVVFEDRKGADAVERLNKTGKISSALESLGGALASSASGDALLSAVRTALTEIADAGDEKKSKEGSKNTDGFTVKNGGVTIQFNVPKASPEDAVGALKETSIKISTSKDDFKSGGTAATTMARTALIKAAQTVGEKAKAGQLKKFDQRALEVARDKAVAVAEQNAKGSTDDEKKAEKNTVKVIMEGHNAALRVAKVAQNLTWNVLDATLSMVQAHY